MFGKLFLGAFALLGAQTPLYAANYSPATPLSMSVQPRDCSRQTSWRMPIITWGADEVTLFANGGTSTSQNSFMSKHGLDIRLTREDDFTKQIGRYMSCESPFLRATLGMISQAADLTEADPRTKGVTIYQHSWSAGGDVMVARADIRQPKDLRGKTIVLQQYGPHVDYVLRILADAGLKPSDVKLRFVADLTGKGSETPMAAILSDRTVGAVMVISPDAATLTSGGSGSVGTGAEGSLKGAHQLLSTKSAPRVITDLIVVRKDFYDANKDKLAQFGRAMYEASDALPNAYSGQTPEWKALMKLSAKTLLDDAGAVSDAQGLWTDAEISDRQGNARFFADVNYPKSFDNLVREDGYALKAAGLARDAHALAAADWDWKAQTDVADVAAAPAPRFNPGAVTQAVTAINSQGKQSDDTLFEFPIHFQNGQKTFQTSFYGQDFDRVIDLSQTYAGAVITVEGHSDPQAFLNQVDRAQGDASGSNRLVLMRVAQAGRNLSIQRAQAVRDAVIGAARAKGIALDPSQFVVVGMGYDQPATGMCGEYPCRPKNEREAASNRTVNFRIINVEAETDAFAKESGR